MFVQLTDEKLNNLHRTSYVSKISYISGKFAPCLNLADKQILMPKLLSHKMLKPAYFKIFNFMAEFPAMNISVCVISVICSYIFYLDFKAYKIPLFYWCIFLHKLCFDDASKAVLQVSFLNMTN